MSFDNRGLRRLQENLRAVSGTNEVPFPELFSPAFMRKHSSHDSIESLIRAGGWSVRSEQDFTAIPDAEWDAHVREHTRFPSWADMKRSAAEEWIAAKLTKGLT
jgi:hypothetical protein